MPVSVNIYIVQFLFALLHFVTEHHFESHFPNEMETTKWFVYYVRLCILNENYGKHGILS